MVEKDISNKSYYLDSRIMPMIKLSKYVCWVTGHEIDTRRGKSSDASGQPHWIFLVSKRVVRCEFLIKGSPLPKFILLLVNLGIHISSNVKVLNDFLEGLGGIYRRNRYIIHSSIL